MAPQPRPTNPRRAFAHDGAGDDDDPWALKAIVGGAKHRWCFARRSRFGPDQNARGCRLKLGVAIRANGSATVADESRASDIFMGGALSDAVGHSVESSSSFFELRTTRPRADDTRGAAL